MIRRTLIFIFAACLAHAAASGRIKLDASVLASLPTKRSAALTLFAITDRDSTAAISEKKAKYIEALKGLVQDLLAANYWNSELPKDIDQAIEKRAAYQARLRYPASPTTGASFYGDLVQSYTVRMYEEEVVSIAFAVSERFTHEDIVVVRGEVRPFAIWKKAWDKAGRVKGKPNQLLSSLTPPPAAS